MLGKMKKVLNNGKGFSLVELIVVIAILGILAGIAAPNVIRYIDQSRVKADVSNAAMIGNAVLAAIATDETITKTDYSTAVFCDFGEAPAANSVEEKIINAVTAAMQSGTLPTVKYDPDTDFAVTIATDGSVAVGIAGDSALDPELFPTLGTYPAAAE